MLKYCANFIAHATFALCALAPGLSPSPLKAQGAVSAATTQLITEIESGEVDLRRSQAMGDLLNDPEEVAAAVPALIEILRGEDRAAGAIAAEALGLIGAAAAPALDALSEIIETETTGETTGALREEAILARTRIALAVEKARFDVRFADGKLSARADDADLRAVLKAISDAARVAVIVDERLADRRITGEVSDAALAEGMIALLGGYDVFYYHRGGAGLLTVWVYDAMDGRGLYPTPPELWASSAELEKQLEDADPDARIAALDNILNRNPAEGARHVVRALSDYDDGVRASALSMALDEGIDLPVDLLSKLAVADRSHGVRFMALKKLWSNPDEEWAAEEAMEQALTDPNPVIRAFAERMLDSLYPPPPQGEGQAAQNVRQ